tara:strand:- start:52 stop:348 length:297 start_codon:yes stop_codon:yes gene_type:complete
LTKYRQAARIDENQNQIVSKLRAYGFSVQVGMDDLLVGFNGRSYWFEIKDPSKTKKKNGDYKAGAVKPSQQKLLHEWRGHYSICCSAEEILEEINNAQ